MRFLLSSFVILFSFNSFAAIHHHEHDHNEPPHMPLELTFQESLNLAKQYKKLKNFSTLSTEIKASIRGGEKMNKWMQEVNSQRPVDQKIRLTSKGTRKGIPVDNPKKYGPSTIRDKYNQLNRDMPSSLIDVIYGNRSISKSLPVADDIFITWARQVSRLYQTAVRWQGSIPYLSYYTARRRDDVRGYYHLKNMVDVDNKLQNFSTLSNQEQVAIKEHLLGLCFNTQEEDAWCEKDFKKYLGNDDLLGMKNRYWKRGKSTWDKFFKITGPRRDVTWSSKNPNEMRVPFKNISDQRIADWLKENVEDEFKRPLKNWEMLIDYKRGGWGTARLNFQSGVTPHVTGGNTIVMDKNVSIDEYTVQWTIRHEFGHILRLPDCYVEFYDEKNKLMINYQLDTTDLMCSRAGDMNDRIYNELKRVYFK
jgi:hypothetical protein